jgi:hypothetical protein
VDPCTGSNELSVSEIPNVRVYPNPSSGIVNVEFGVEYENVRVEVLNTLGQVIASENANNLQHVSFHMSYHPAGVYFIQVLKDKKVVGTQKLIKQ